MLTNAPTIEPRERSTVLDGQLQKEIADAKLLMTLWRPPRWPMKTPETDGETDVHNNTL